VKAEHGGADARWMKVICDGPRCWRDVLECAWAERLGRTAMKIKLRTEKNYLIFSALEKSSGISNILQDEASTPWNGGCLRRGRIENCKMHNAN
jgi:hypothetical protein